MRSNDTNPTSFCFKIPTQLYNYQQLEPQPDRKIDVQLDQLFLQLYINVQNYVMISIFQSEISYSLEIYQKKTRGMYNVLNEKSLISFSAINLRCNFP